MATINQSPAGQTSVSLSGIVLDSIDASGTPFWQSRKIVGSASVQIQLGGEQTVALLGRAIGTVSSASASSASGLFSLNEQSAAKRLGSWPSS